MRYLLLFIFITYQATSWASCERMGWDQSVILKTINDGDTVTLTNGRRVRFIGINTPEINYHDLSKSEPYALQAKQLLQKYIRPGDKLHLIFDHAKKDKYGRILAYVYSKTGRNLALMQLQSGYAKQWVIANNDKYWLCFQQAERQARFQKKGIWSDFMPLKAQQLEKTNKGYQIITGRISALQKSTTSIEFYLDEKLKVTIKKAQLMFFKQENINFSLNQRLLISGKLRFYKNKPQLGLYHPVQILP